MIRELTTQIVNSISDVSGGRAVLHEPEITGNAHKYVTNCLDTGWVSTAGGYVPKFEDKLTEFTGAKHAIATMNGTAALHIALVLAEVKPGDEVIVPSQSFIATANAVSYCGAVPHFADCNENTLGLDPDKLRDHLAEIAAQENGVTINRQTGRPVKCVVCMHSFGHSVDLDAILDVCGDFNLPLIEDAAESLGSYYRGDHTGTKGLISALSFNGNKIVTSGNGGAVITNDDELAEKARHLTTTAKLEHQWEFEHDQIGYNYRLSNLSAALGCAQMEMLPSFLERKRTLADLYQKAFENVDGLGIFREADFSRSNYWLNVLLLDVSDLNLRDSILRAANDAGLGTRPAWMPSHRLEMFAGCPRMDLSVTENLYGRIITLPSSAKLAGD